MPERKVPPCPGLSRSIESMSPAVRYPAKFVSTVRFSLRNSPRLLVTLRGVVDVSPRVIAVDDQAGNEHRGDDAVGDAPAGVTGHEETVLVAGIAAYAAADRR